MAQQPPLNQNLDLANSLAGLWGKVFGSKGSTETTTVTGGQRVEQTMMSEDAVNGLIRQIMTGSRTGKAFADVASQGKRAGIYNSPTSRLLNQNFISNVAQDVALASAPKVTTVPNSVTTRSGINSQQGVLPSRAQLPALLLAGLLNKDVRAAVKEGYGKIAGKKKPTRADAEESADLADQVNPELSEALRDAYGFGDAASFEPATGAPLPDVPLLEVPGMNEALGGFLDVGNFASADTFDAFSVSEAASVADFVDFGGAADLIDVGGFAADGFDLASDIIDVGGFAADAVDSVGGLADFGLGDAAPFVGPALDIIEGDYTSAALTGLGYAVGGPVGGFVGNVVGEVVGGGSVICTELINQGKLDKHLWENCKWYRSNISSDIITGYHCWAKPYVRIMQRKDLLGKLAVAFIKPWVTGRYEYIDGKFSLLGMITCKVGEPICGMIGKLIKLINRKSNTNLVAV